jgi:hypothetical protein
LGGLFIDWPRLLADTKWGMAIAGLAVCFGSQLMFALVLGFIVGVDYEGSFIGISELACTAMGIAVSALCTWGFYEFSKSTWRKKKTIGDYELLDEDLTEDDYSSAFLNSIFARFFT